MRLNFKKVSAIAASALMVGMTMGTAVAATNYPAPFVAGASSSVAVVYGASAAQSDVVQASNIQNYLSGKVTTSGTTSASVNGEAIELTKIYVNDSINLNRDSLTETHLPNVLEDGAFNGNVDATFSQKIQLGSNPKVVFTEQPTGNDDMTYNIGLSTSQTQYIYNATVSFNKAINFSHADSEGEDLTIFGMDFTIGAATDENTLVLLKSAEKVDLDSNTKKTADVTVSGKEYTIGLTSASDTAATISVTDKTAGTTESKEVSEAASKKINGITIAVQTASSSTASGDSASIIAGSEKVTMEDGSSVTIGEDDTIIDGTLVDFGTGTPGNLTSLTVSVYAPESDEDAILPGESFVDPVYGSFKLNFAGFNIDSTVGSESTDRETISFTPEQDDRMKISFFDSRGEDLDNFVFAKNVSTGVLLQNGDGENITVFEKEKFHKGEYVIVGNEDNGYLLECTAAYNQTGGYSSDKVEFKDVLSGTTYTTYFSDDTGVGTLAVGAKDYAVTLQGASGIASETYNVSIGFPESSGATEAIVFPTIETSKGALVQFYEPKTIVLTNWNVENGNLTTLKLPDGDGYTDVTFAMTKGDSTGNFTVDASHVNGTYSKAVNVGQLTYNFTYSAANTTIVYLQTVAGVNILQPAVVVFEGKDDNSAYEALIVELEEGGTSDDGMGVDTVEDTWSNAASAWTGSRSSDSDMTDRGDLYGAVVTVDSSDSDQKKAIVSIPDEQIYPIVYVAEESATITAGQTSAGGALGNILVEDSKITSVSDKNLVVVGGSCINAVAAKLLGSAVALCGPSFTEKTGVGTGQFLIQSFASPYTTGKVALLVAGYDATDTVNAVTYLNANTVDTTAGKKYKSTSATTVEQVTTSE